MGLVLDMSPKSLERVLYFAADLFARDLNSAALADLTLIAATSLVLSAHTFEIFCGAKDIFTEQAAPLSLKSSVVYRLGFSYLSVRPASYHFRRSQTDLYGIKFSVHILFKPYINGDPLS